MKKQQSVLLCAVLTLAAISAAHAAEDQGFELSPEQLFNATVISVSKTPEKLMDAPAAIFVLTNEDIMRSGATSIPEALRLVPGVDVARANANSWAVSVRGFNGTLADKLLVLVDGRAVYDPLFSGTYWDIQDLMLEDIDRIEVIRGPGAALWGANAVNGVINIITKKAQDTQGNLVSATLGNQDGIVGERYGGKLGNNGYYRVYAKYTNRNDEQNLANTNAHDGQAMDHAGFRTDWKSASDLRDDFTVEGDAYRSNASQYRYSYTLSAPFKQLNLEDIYANGGNVLGRWNRTYSEDSKLSVRSYMEYVRRDQLLLGDKRDTFDIDAQYEFPQLGRHKIIVGGGYRYSADFLTATPDVSFSEVGEYTQIFNSFFQDKITLEPKTWFLTLGSKLEHNSYTGFEVEPDARLQWQPDERNMVWSSVSRAVRTPSRLEEALNILQVTTSTPFSLSTMGDTAFGSEDVIAYELGYRRKLTPQASLDIATFYNDYSNLSTLDLTASNLTTSPFFLNYSYGNQTWGHTYGAETTLDWRVTEKWKLSGSFSALEMHLYDPSANALGVKNPETQSPKYQYNLRSQWDVTKDLSYDVMLYHVSALTQFPVPGYSRLDMRLSWRMMQGLEFNLVGQNLFSPSHLEFGSPTDIHTPATEINRAVYGQFIWRY